MVHKFVLSIPQLTEERRKEIVKVVHKKAEDAKLQCNIRRDVNEALKRRKLKRLKMMLKTV